MKIEITADEVQALALEVSSNPKYTAQLIDVINAQVEELRVTLPGQLKVAANMSLYDQLEPDAPEWGPDE